MELRRMQHPNVPGVGRVRSVVDPCGIPGQTSETEPLADRFERADRPRATLPGRRLAGMRSCEDWVFPRRSQRARAGRLPIAEHAPRSTLFAEYTMRLPVGW